MSSSSIAPTPVLGDSAGPARAPDLSTPSRTVGRPGTLVSLAVAGGVALDLGFRGGAANVLVSLGVLAAIAVALSRPEISHQGRLLVAAAAVPGLFLAVWTSPWLATADLLAAVGLGMVGVAYSASGDVFDTTVRQAVVRAWRADRRGLAGLAPLARATPRPSSGGVRQLGRTGGAILLALPLLVALVALLASADVVFSRFVSLPNLDIGPVVGHVVVAGVLATVLVVGGLAVGAEPIDREHRGWFAATEVVVVLGLAAGVLALFVVSQVVALTGAGQRLVAEAGLTPAEYARGGFFQLCWASVVVVAHLALVRWLAAPGVFGHRLVRWVAASVPVLALGLVVVSLRRMALYDQAFGLTMLRLAVVAAAVWIGLVLCFLAVRNLGLGPDRGWVPGVAVAAGLALLLGANLANPEAFVVRHNVARAATGAEVDTSYLSSLSDDAVPALVTAAEATDDLVLQSRLVAALDCAQDHAGVARANLAHVLASRTRARHCA